MRIERSFRSLSIEDDFGILYASIYDDYIYLNKIKVDKDHRNNGLGSKLMDLLISESDDKPIKLDVYPLGYPTEFYDDQGSFMTEVYKLIKFYRKFGFEVSPSSNIDLGEIKMFRN